MRAATKMNTNRGIMFKKSRREFAADGNPGDERLARREADLNYDQAEETPEGSAEETARYIADMVGALAAMAGEAKLDLLTYLLNMARVEAELQARQSETPDDPSEA